MGIGLRLSKERRIHMENPYPQDKRRDEEGYNHLQCDIFLLGQKIESIVRLMFYPKGNRFFFFGHHGNLIEAEITLMYQHGYAVKI